MPFIKQLLKSIPDAHVIGEFLSISAPVKDLVDGYNKIANEDGNDLVPITEESTGADLKEALEKLDMADQVRLLAAYGEAMKHRDTHSLYVEDPEKRDERQLRIWVVKAFTTFVMFIGTLIIGAVVAMGWRTGVMDGAIVNGVMSTATEIFKLIFVK